MPGQGAGKSGSSAKLLSPKAALSVANSVIGAILGTTALVYIAQNMGPTVLGTLGYAMVVIGLLSFLSDFGVGSVHAMQVKSCGDTGKCIGAYAAIRLVLLGVFSVVTFIIVELWQHDMMGGSMPLSPDGMGPLIDCMWVFLVYYILLGISQIATHTFEALDAPAKSMVPSLLELVVRVSFIVYIATSPLGTGTNGAALLASSYAAGIMAAMILVALLMSKYRIEMPDREILMKYIRSLAPVFTVSITIIIDLYLDKVVVGYFWGETELGLYFGVQKMAIFVGVFSLSVATLILPSVTTYFVKKDVGASWDIVNQAERYVSLIVIPTAAFYLMYGIDVIRVFLGNDFTGAVRTMDVLVISAAVFALVLPLRSAIVGAGSPSALFKIGTGGLILQLALLLIFVPDDVLGVKMFGLKGQGAALALLFASIYYFFALRYTAWSIAKILPNSGSFKHLIAAVTMIGAMYVVDWLFVSHIDWVALTVLAVIGTLTYGVAAYFIGELEYSDYKHFRSMLNPQDTLQYVLHELLGKRV
jgi:O-antigen/teichoic acid export membrane protein